jgi:cytoskeletal protein RodZ
MEDSKEEYSKTENNPDKNKKWLMWLLIALVVLLLALGGWLWWQLKAAQAKERQLEKDKQNLQQLVDGLKNKEPKDTAPAEEEQACNDTASSTMKENIKAALDTKNTAVFATYVTNPVKYVLAASEYGGDVSPDEAATSLEYTHGATGPWDFNLPAATVDGYDAGFYTDYFDDNTYIGRAASGMVVAFDFDCNGKIKQIFVAGDEDLL